jgi:hypothetical protein
MNIMRYSDFTLQEIADKFGLSRERVRQIIGNTGHSVFTSGLRPPKPRQEKPPPRIIPSWERDRFWSKVNIIRDAESCWEWAASGNGEGYGQFAVERVPIGAHRAAWYYINGPIPNGLCVLHKCDNKLCVRPSHLFLGTHQDNVDDMIAKGRQRPTPAHKRTYGEDHHQSKLTWSKVDEIRRLQKEGTKGSVIQREYFPSFSKSCIYSVMSGRTWPENRRIT